MTTGMLIRRIRQRLGDYFYTIDQQDNYPVTSSAKRPNNVFFIHDKNQGKTFKITVEETKGASK